MNTKTLAAVAGAIILLVGVGGFLFLNNSKKQAPLPQRTSQTIRPNLSTQATIESLLSSKTPQQCHFTDNLTTNRINGIIFVANGKARGDFQMQSLGVPTISHMISDGTNFYIWTGVSKQGFKLSLAAAKSAAANAQNSQSPDINKVFDFRCINWIPNNSRFVLPTDITFSSIALPNTSKTAVTPATGSSANCSVCNSIPQGAQRTACQTALHCK